MNSFKLSLYNIASRPLSALLTVVMLTLGVALVSVLLQVGSSLDDSFRKNIRGIDMVVGAKGSPLQLILSAIYQIDNPTGNISRSEAQALSRHPMVKQSIELSYGDSYKGRQIVGTSHDYPALYGIQLKEGRLWDKAFEATIGAQIAEEFGLKPGDVFFSAHGSDMEAEVHEEHPFTVVGVFEPSGTVIDRLLLTSLQSIWDVHPPAPGDTLADSRREITALMLQFKSKMGILTLPRYVNKETSMQAALPAIEVNRLFELFGMGIAALRIVAIVIMVLGGISIFVSMLNALKERAYEMALIRSMGASRSQVFGMIILEALILGALGYILGIVLAHLGLWLLSQGAGTKFGIAIDPFVLMPAELWLLAIIALLCILAAIIPAIKTSGMDVSKVISTYAQ
jgi:putative ABC transport system permease protein